MKSILIYVFTLSLVALIALAYINKTETKIQQLTEQSAQLANDKEQLTAQIENIQAAYKLQTNALIAYNEKIANLQKEKLALQKMFISHDLENLSKEKPVLVERIINEGTKKIFSDFVYLSSE